MTSCSRFIEGQNLISAKITRRQEITKSQFSATRITLLCREFSMIKSKVYVNSTHQGYSLVCGYKSSSHCCFLRSPFSHLMRASLSCFSRCLVHAQKEFWVILPFHDKGRPPDSHFIYFFHKCRATQSYQQNTASIEVISFQNLPKLYR